MSGGSAADPRWFAALRARADQPPLRQRVPLWAGKAQIGTVEPELARAIAPRPLADGTPAWASGAGAQSGGWRLGGDASACLDRLAWALREAGLAGAWRNEQLTVADAQGARVGSVERAAVRPLGLATRAVHLVGFVPDGRVWVQQRALDKANDPGLWDTLMGGMVSDADTIEAALQRETWEEAGLHVAALHGMARGGEIVIRRPSADAQGAGYMVERIDWFRCTVPQGVRPDNQDGEVAAFELLELPELLARLQRDEFTLEAALILCAACGLSPANESSYTG